MFESDEWESCHSCLYGDMYDIDEEPCKYCYGLSLYTKKEKKMIDVNLRRYGQDKDYEKMVNAFLKGEELTLDCEFEKDSLEKLREMCSIPDDIKKKLVDIYNYIAINRNSRIELRFDTGIKFVCEIDDSEWKNPPRIDLDEVLKEKEEFHCGVEESEFHAYNCNDCPNKCEEWYRWDKEFREKGDEDEP